MNWSNLVLKIAGIYNILWGAWVILFPESIFNLFEMAHPHYPMFWQCIGMIVGVYGIGYWIASYDPIKHWPVVFVGLVGKILGPIGFLQAIYLNTLPLNFGINILFNDLIWWIPFALILKKKFNIEGFKI